MFAETPGGRNYCPGMPVNCPFCWHAEFARTHDLFNHLDNVGKFNKTSRGLKHLSLCKELRAALFQEERTFLDFWIKD